MGWCGSDRLVHSKCLRSYFVIMVIVQFTVSFSIAMYGVGEYLGWHRDDVHLL
jgi:hypothetical protein